MYIRAGRHSLALAGGPDCVSRPESNLRDAGAQMLLMYRTIARKMILFLWTPLIISLELGQVESESVITSITYQRLKDSEMARSTLKYYVVNSTSLDVWEGHYSQVTLADVTGRSVGSGKSGIFRPASHLRERFSRIPKFSVRKQKNT